MKMSDKSKANNLVKVSLRIDPEDQPLIQKCADRWGCTFSEAARRLLSSSINNVSKQNSISYEHEIRLAAKSMRSDFRRISADYSRFVHDFNIALNVDNNLNIAIRDVRELVSLTLILQSDINELLGKMSEKEVHYCARITVADGIEIDDVNVDDLMKNFLKKYTYMQRIEIIGTLSEAPATYTPKGASTQKKRLKIECEYTKNDASVKETYTVYTGAASVPDNIAPGAVVYVSGDFRRGSDDAFLIYASVIRIFPTR